MREVNDVFQVRLSPFLILLAGGHGWLERVRPSWVHPVPVMRATIPFERQRRVRCLIALRRRVLRWLVLGQDLHCAVLVAAREFDMPRQIAFEDARIGMVKTVAIAYLKYRDKRLDRVEERLGRGGLAAMVRHEEDLRRQGFTVPPEQDALDRRLDIRG